MDALKKLIDERTEKQRQITDLKDQIKQLSGQEKKGDKATKLLKTHLAESVVCMGLSLKVNPLTLHSDLPLHI